MKTRGQTDIHQLMIIKCNKEQEMEISYNVRGVVYESSLSRDGGGLGRQIAIIFDTHHFTFKE